MIQKYKLNHSWNFKSEKKNKLKDEQLGILPDRETRGVPFKASRSGSKRQNPSRSGSLLAFFCIVQEKWPVHNSFQPTSI
jgi:hypothetical protein